MAMFMRDMLQQYYNGELRGLQAEIHTLRDFGEEVTQKNSKLSA